MKRLFLCLLVLGCGISAPALGNDTFDGNALDEDTFVVSAYRRATPLREVGSSVSVVTAAELEAQGVFYVEDALRRLAGVQASSSGGRGGQVAVRLRGEEGYRTLVLIDGIRVSDAALPQGAVNFGNLTVTGIDRIEVLRGPQALMYGADAIGGVINVITRRGTEDRSLALSLEAGSNDTYRGRGFAGAAANGIDLALSGDITQTRGISAKVGDPSLSDDDGYRNLTLHGVAGFAPSAGTRIEAVVRYMDAYAQFDGFSFDPDRELLTEEVAGRLSIATDELDGARHQLAYNYFRSRRDDLDGGVPAEDFFGTPISRFDSDRHEVDYLAAFEPLNGHGLTVGANYRVEEVETDGIDERSTVFAVFAEWQAQWSPRFFTTLGARFDAPEDFGDHVSVRATTAYLLPLLAAGETKLRASIGTGFRAPSAFERAFNRAAGLAALEEETGAGFDVGIDQPLFGGQAHASVTYFDQRIEDEIRFDNVGFTGYFQADGTSHSRGVEARVEGQLMPQLAAAVSYTFTDAAVNSPDAEDGLMRVRRPRHTGAMDFDYTGDGGRLRVNLNMRGVADSEDGFREFRTELDDYLVFGVSASYEVVDGVALTVRGVNLTDARYQEVAGFSTLGRSGFAGVRVRF